MSNMFYDQDPQDPYQPIYSDQYPPPFDMYHSHPTQYSSISYSAGPPKNAMYGNESPQNYGNHYMPAEYAYPPQSFIVNFQIPVEQQQRWPGETPPPLVPTESDESRRADEGRVSSKQNTSVPIKLPANKPKGRPGRKPGPKAAQRIPPAEADIKTENPKRKRKARLSARRYANEEERIEGRRECGRIAQRKSRQRKDEKIALLENTLKDMKREVGTLFGSIFESLSIMSEYNMPEILQSPDFKDLLQSARKANDKWFTPDSTSHIEEE